MKHSIALLTICSSFAFDIRFIHTSRSSPATVPVDASCA